jgi:serine phosphatase RsbU (regulator of sigma subunit)
MVLRPSTRVGELRVESRYLPSAHGSSGDIQSAVATPFGVRLLIGDVMGTGWEASLVGASLLDAWGELARSERSLAGVAVRLHHLIARSGQPERFVTALLINFPHPASPGNSLTELVCCGHPPPLLLRGGSATFLSTLQVSPPLGLLDLADGWCAATSMAFGDGDGLLLYTDGLSEARDPDGAFFPMCERVEMAMNSAGAVPGGEAAASGTAGGEAGGGTAGGGTAGQHPLDVLMASLREHIGTGADGHDDVLMVLAQRG